MILPVTLTIAAAVALINLWLALRLVQLRRGRRVLTGDGGEPLVLARMRAQANLNEYAPVILVLMALVEMAGGSPTWLWVLGVAFVIARLLHPFGMDRPSMNALRAVGALVTWIVTALLIGWALAIVYGAARAPAVRVVPMDMTETRV